jgi:hypothetical protein
MYENDSFSSKRDQDKNLEKFQESRQEEEFSLGDQFFQFI